GADGAAFMLQNDSRGLNALGGFGGGLGYGTANAGTPVTHSAGIGLNVYSGANNGNGLYLLEGGAVISTTATSPVNLASGDPITVSVSYDGIGAISVTLDDTATNQTYSTSYNVGNLATLVAGSTAYVGFSGADGGLVSTQTISSFSFQYSTPQPNVLPTATRLIISNSATVDLYGANQTVGSLSGAGTVTNSLA